MNTPCTDEPILAYKVECRCEEMGRGVFRNGKKGFSVVPECGTAGFPQLIKTVDA